MTRYLLVDNAPAVLQALRRDLSLLDGKAQFSEADSGDAALRQASDWQPDVVFIGLGLAHGERGLPVVDRLLRHDPARPVIICTSLPRDHPDVGEAISLGSFAFLPKPVRQDAVRQILVQLETLTGRLRRVR